MSIRLILADDHPIVLDGLLTLFQFEPDIEVVARCSNGTEALAAVRKHSPDVLILDLLMAGNEDLAVMRTLLQEELSTRVVLLTAQIRPEQMAEAARLGVRGVLLKEMAPSLIVRCVRKVHAGGRWLETQSFGAAFDHLLEREATSRETMRLLTPREIDLVRLVAKGLRNAEIAERLFISEGTVKVHLHNIYQKLNVDRRMALVRYAEEKGLL
jgi:two-component system, NarL family, nitrate/nitrite response regulator NarL